ncbi:hypothetical protein L596_022000 [Steinernema carpocapsae]|uniref:DOMON domain-containing protein n=1 Tax=Steinernema carpocapsae TaxID=34508 RepID=A0A4U5MKE3_STECR|nr:hypothetical protein L596_022000 [Steinernema carpocapsae]
MTRSAVLCFFALVFGVNSQYTSSYQSTSTYSNQYQNSNQYNNGAGPQCWFSNSNGFNLSWTVDNNKNVIFNLRYPNYPTFASWVGVGFGSNSQNITMVLLEVANGQVSIASAKMSNGNIQKENQNTLVSASGIVNVNTLQATFVKSLKEITDAAQGSSCVQWNFYATPRMTGQSQIPITKQICNVDQTCPYMGTQTVFGNYQDSQYGFGNNYNNQYGQPQFNNGYSNQYQVVRVDMAINKDLLRQTINASTNLALLAHLVAHLALLAHLAHLAFLASNAYNSNFQYSTQHPNLNYLQQQRSYDQSNDFLVQNPNYRFLDQSLQQRYEQNQNLYQNQNARMYDSNSPYSQGGYSNQNQPMLTNQQQNQLNYQRIQQDYRNNPNPNAGRTFTNNIYGYDYRSNPNQQYTYVSNSQQQYQPPQYQRVPVKA